MTSDGEALLRAICEQPWEETPRLAYADWLDENGDPERAEFIRLQCEIERKAGDRSGRREMTAREQALIDKHRRKWVRGRPRGAGVQWWPEFVGGFPHGVTIRFAKRFVERAAEVFAWAPVDSVGVTLVTAKTIDSLFGVEYLRRLVYFSVGGRFGDDGCRSLSLCPHLLNVRRLDVYGTAMTDAGLEWLARSPHLNELRQVYLSVRLTDRGALALADAPGLPQLESLHLMGMTTLTPAAERRLRTRFAVEVWR